MKLLILTLLFSINANAEELSCETSVSDQAVKLATIFYPPNCLKNVSKVQLANAFSKDKAREKDRIKVCSNCDNLLSKDKITISSDREEFVKATFDELRKSMSQLTLELVALRSNKELKFSSSMAIDSCNIESAFNDKNCASNPLVKPQVALLQKQIAAELANILQNGISESGLLERDAPKCSITDKEFLFSKNRFIEDQLPSIISLLKKLDTKSTVPMFSQLGELLSTSNSKMDLSALISHPILAGLFANPETFKTFQTSLQVSDNADTIRNKLYDSKNADIYNKSVSQRCTDYFKAVKANLCSPQFQASNFAADTKASLEAIKGLDSTLASANSDKKVSAMVSYCQDMKFKKDDTILFSTAKDILNKDLDPSLKDATYNKFKIDAYRMNIMDSKSSLCEIAMGSKSCEEGTQTCSLYKQWKESQEPGSETKNLLAAHDVNIDKILRSLIGEPKDLNDDTKRILIAEGILKNPEGTYNIKDTPERKTDYVSAPASNSGSAALENTTKITNATAKPVKNTQAATQDSPSAPPVSYPTNSTASSDNQPLPFSSSPSPDEEIRNNLQKQILDRLGKQVTSKQIEDMVAKAYNKGRANPMTQQQVEEKTREVLEDMPTNSIGGGSSFNNNQGTAKVSVDKDREKKARQLGFLKAKYGIDPNAPAGSKGAQGKAGSNGDENLKVVAVTNAAELKIVVGDFKNLKNAQIAELMKKQTPFILQIGKVAYKIAFQNGQLEIIPPKGVQRDPATISNLQNYILNLAKAQPDRSLYNELMKVNFKG